MIYRVIYTEIAHDDIRAQVRYLRQERVSEQTIEDWFNRLFDLVDSLADWPRRYAVSERESAERGYEIRKVNFGDHLIFYHVIDERQLVEVIGFRHGARSGDERDQSSE